MSPILVEEEAEAAAEAGDKAVAEAEAGDKVEVEIEVVVIGFFGLLKEC